MRQFSLYCRSGESVSFRELMKKGLSRREIVLGYLVREQGESDLIELNPARDSVITPGPQDMVVIISER